MPRAQRTLLYPTLLNIAPATILTIGTNQLQIARHIHVTNLTGASIKLTMSINTGGSSISSLTTHIFHNHVIPAETELEHYCRYALAPGDTIQASASVDASLSVVIAGDVDTL